MDAAAAVALVMFFVVGGLFTLLSPFIADFSIRMRRKLEYPDRSRRDTLRLIWVMAWLAAVMTGAFTWLVFQF
jgi:hypothetical protein